MQSKSRIYASPPPPSDRFDRIPDSLVLLILNKVLDVRSLGRCSAVSKRLNSLVPLVHHVHLKIDRVLSSSPSPKPRTLLSRLLSLLLQPFLPPLPSPNTHQILKPSPAQVLQNFSHLRHLLIELPSGDVHVASTDGVVLRWRAQFGSSLHNCVILGGTPKNSAPSVVVPDDNGSIPESFYTNGGLKLRVVWTISSLIAASTRHYLLRPIIGGHPTLRSVVLTDADGQGTLSMGEEGLREFREKPLAAEACSANRTRVPASSMKLRYAPYIEFRDGVGMEGATLVAIRAEGEGGRVKEAEAFMDGSFDGWFRDAVKVLVKRRTYLLEMNGF